MDIPLEFVFTPRYWRDFITSAGGRICALCPVSCPQLQKWVSEMLLKLAPATCPNSTIPDYSQNLSRLLREACPDELGEIYS